MEYVYVLSNPYMPGIYKIGRTTISVAQRISELSSPTSVPADFVEEMKFVVPDSIIAERWLHKELKEYRINPKREFFKCSKEDIEKASSVLAPLTWDLFMEMKESLEIIVENHIHQEGISPFLNPDYVREYEFDAKKLLDTPGFYHDEDGSVHWRIVDLEIGSLDFFQNMLDQWKNETQALPSNVVNL